MQIQLTQAQRELVLNVLQERQIASPGTIVAALQCVIQKIKAPNADQ